MKKNGFTLVELLAVIIILGLLALLIVPKVNSIVKKSKVKSYEVSINNLVKSLNSIAIDKKANLISFNGCIIDFDNDNNTCTDLEYSGELPDSGSISVDSDGVVNGSVEYGDNGFNVINNKVLFNDYVVGYQELDYIMSDGNQYIDLGYKAKKNTEIRLDIQFVPNENTDTDTAFNTIVGKEITDNKNANFAINFGGEVSQKNEIFYWVDKHYGYGGEIKSRVYASSEIANRSTMIVKSGSATFHGKTIEIATKTQDNTENMILLGGYNSTTQSVLAFNRYDAKIYGFQIYEGENLVHDYVPSLRVSDGVAGLYDIVDGLFYSSDGSEQFIKGEY